MTVWDYLTSPAGIELTHAVIVVLVALAAWLSAKAHSTATTVDKKLTAHINGHSEPDGPQT